MTTIDDTGAGGADDIDAEGGDDVVFGDHGQVVQAAGVLKVLGTGSVESAFTTNLDGAVDEITGAGGNNVIFGGGGGDEIDGADGDNIIIGDYGRAEFTPAGVRTFAETTDAGVGDADQITSGSGNNVILAGDGNDIVRAGSGDDIILGDNGFADFSDAGVLIQITSTDPELGGVDDIDAGAGADVVVGGAKGDVIFAGGDEDADVVIGDDGEAFFTDTDIIQLAYTIAPEFGGDDEIDTGGGDNIVIAGSGKDEVDAEAGNDVVLGDNGQVEFDEVGVLALAFTTHTGFGDDDEIDAGDGRNVVVGGNAEDTIDTGDGRDVVLGDNGRLDFVNDGGRAVLVKAKSTVPLIGGDDIIRTDGYKDIVFGGTGEDWIEGGAGFDVILGDHGLFDINLPANQRAVSIFIGPQYGAGDDHIDGGTARRCCPRRAGPTPRSGSSPQPNTACASCGESPEQLFPPGRSCSWISASSSFPSVTTMSQKSSVIQLPQFVP